LAITVSPDRVILTGVSYIEAGFEASWTDVAVFAEVTFPDLLSVDVINPLDRPFKSLTRPVVDGFNANTDSLSQQFQKALADVITVTEGPEFTYIYGARESDTQALADAFRYAKSKLLAPETLHLIDNMDGNVEFAMVKVIGELQLLQDALRTNLQKNLADIITITEGPEFTYTYAAGESDTQALADAFRYSKSKLLAPETIALLDDMDGDIQFAFTKAAADIQSFQDVLTTSAHKNLADNTEPVDLFTKLLIAIRVFTESLTSSDTIEYFDFGKVLAETPTPVDFIRFANTKPLTDTSPALDESYWHLFKVALGSAYDYTLPFPEPAYFAQNYVGGVVGEELSASDVFLSERIYGRFPIDAVNLGDGGVLNVQDYASTTYFAADYVGVGRTL
jgi:hypothetical protein